MKKMNIIKNHFEEEATKFDEIILKLIPFYNEMLEALVSAIPFKKDDRINIIDLGCGSGTIAMLIKQKFINSQITCLDLAEKMIEIAKMKLNVYNDVVYINEDFNNLKFDKKYDAVVSSLALHHLINDNDKNRFYKKIYQALNKGGVFFNADVVLGSSSFLQDFYMEKWKKYMNKKVEIDEINNLWLKKYKEEDRPAKLINQIYWLKKIGFKNIDVIWKYYNYAVYGGFKK